MIWVLRGSEWEEDKSEWVVRRVAHRQPRSPSYSSPATSRHSAIDYSTSHLQPPALLAAALTSLEPITRSSRSHLARTHFATRSEYNTTRPVRAEEADTYSAHDSSSSLDSSSLVLHHVRLRLAHAGAYGGDARTQAAVGYERAVAGKRAATIELSRVWVRVFFSFCLSIEGVATPYLAFTEAPSLVDLEATLPVDKASH